MASPRTAFVFPGLNGASHIAEHLPLLRLPGFAPRWQVVVNAFANQPSFIAFSEALYGGRELPTGPATWPWRALATAAMQLATAEALERQGERADWLCGYSVGEVGRACHAGVMSFAAIVAFAAALPALPMVDGSTAAVHCASAALADDMVQRLARQDVDDVSCSRLSPRFLMVAGSRDAVARAMRDCRVPGVHTQELAACALHAPLQRPVSDVLGMALSSGRLARPGRAMFSTLWGRPVAAGDDLRVEFAANVAASCDFAATVRRLHVEHGVTRFIDLGPGRHAMRFVRHHDLPIVAIAASMVLEPRAEAPATLLAGAGSRITGASA